jgi:AmpD protein
VIHAISLPPGRFSGPFVEDLFMGRLDPRAHPYFEKIQGLRVSAHLFIARDGRITQFVPFHRRAWHAGVSCFRGRSRCNDFSIGIELEGTDSLPFAPLQYEALAACIRALQRAYPTLAPDAVTGHEHVAPGRKTDPGPWFDWERLGALLGLDPGRLPAPARA